MKNFLFITSIGFILWGCIYEHNLVDSTQIGVHCDLNSMDIGFPQVHEGDVHNRLVDLLITNWSICSVSTELVASEVKRIFRDSADHIYILDNLDTEEFRRLVNDFDFSQSLSMYMDGGDPDFEDYIETLEISTTLKSRLKGLVDLLEQADV